MVVMTSNRPSVKDEPVEEEGDGDLGLQEMTLDDSSPRQESRAAFSGIYKLFAGVGGANGQSSIGAEIARSSSAAELDRPKRATLESNSTERQGKSSMDSQLHRYHVHAEQDDRASSSGSKEKVANERDNKSAANLRSSKLSTAQLGDNAVELSPRISSKGKERQKANERQSVDQALAMSLSSDSREGSSDVKRKEKDERKVQRRISRLHNDIAGPVSDRPLAGSTHGPPVLPRRASAVLSSPKSSSRSAQSRRGSLPDSVAETDSLAQSAHHLNASTPSRRMSSSHVTFASNEQGQRGLGINTRENGQAAIASIEGPNTSPMRKFSGVPTESVAYSGVDHLDVSALQRWVLSVGCVNFDLEKGPDLEFLYPSLGISREERDNIAFSSFPDTSIFDDGSAVFSWRVREVPLDSSENEAPVIASPIPIVAGMTSDIPKSASPTMIDASWSRKHQHSGARRLFGGGLDRSRGANRSSSTDDVEDAQGRTLGHKAAHDPSDGSMTTEGARGTLTVPRRRGSTASTHSSLSTENSNNVNAFAELMARRSSTPGSAIDHSSLAVKASDPTRRNSSTSANYIHGYCFFRQKRDAKIRRGYFQKSLVILSHLPYVSLFSELVRKLGPLFFESGMPALEAFCHDVQNWETPEPGAKLHLPFLGSMVSVELPFHSFSQTSSLPEAPLTSTTRSLVSSSGADAKLTRTADGSREGEPILASIPSTPLLEVFREAIDDLWLLWECLLLAEPILVVGPDPTACSEAIWHMVNMIKPIPFAGDFRPFFTIHDYDFRTLVTKNKPSSGVMLGVTNPFMLQACKHWPHVLKVGRGAIKRSGHLRKASGSDGGAPLGGVAGGNSAGGGGPEHMPGLVTKRKRRISKERTLIKQLLEAVDTRHGHLHGLSMEQANEALNKYFADLTERFLAPLNRYLSSLIPSEFDLSSPNETPNIKSFNTTAFLSSLKQHGTPLPLKSRNLPTGAALRQSLYVDFLQCPNFSLWLHSRIRQSQEEQYMRKLSALTTGNVAAFTTTKGEVEAMELYARLNVEIVGINDRLIVGRKERELEPNSRWKSADPTATGSGAEIGAQDRSRSSSGGGEGADVAQQQQLTADETASSLTMAFGPSSLSSSSTVSPLQRLAALPSKRSSAVWIRQTMGEPGWTRSFTHLERTLLMRKAGLIDQLDRLVSNLPDDLRQTLLLKERPRSIQRIR